MRSNLRAYLSESRFCAQKQLQRARRGEAPDELNWNLPFLRPAREDGRGPQPSPAGQSAGPAGRKRGVEVPNQSAFRRVKTARAQSFCIRERIAFIPIDGPKAMSRMELRV